MSKFVDVVKSPTVAVALISTMTAVGGGLYHLLETRANAVAELKMRDKYDKVITELIVLKSECDR